MVAQSNIQVITFRVSPVFVGPIYPEFYQSFRILIFSAMVTCGPTNCTMDPPPLEPNPDIAGIGVCVLLFFMTCLWVTLLLIFDRLLLDLCFRLISP